MGREIVLRTARLVLTTWDAVDLDDLHRMHSDAATMRFIGGRPETRAESEARLARYLDEQSTRGWTKWRVTTTDASFVGRAGFGAYDDDRELGYTLARTWWAKGLATEVCLALVDWHREHPARRTSERGGEMDLWGYADLDNVASVRVLAKAGLRFVETRHAFGHPLRLLPPGRRTSARRHRHGLASRAMAEVRETDTLVVGASAAGLAAAACLKEAGVAFEVLEREDVVGSAWRHHYDRLHLHTPKSVSSLPGLPMPRHWPRYPSRDQVVQYLEHYAGHHGITPHFGTDVTSLVREDGGWTATTSNGTWRASNVVLATGATRKPVRPTWPGMDEYAGDLLHSSEYRNGEQWRARTVLVVGFGNSACEQAIDLVEHGVVAHMAVRSAVNVLPRDVFGVVPVLQLGIVMRHLPPQVADLMAAPMVAATVGDVGKGTGLTKLPYGPNTQIAQDNHIPLLDIGTMDHIRAGRITVHPGIERFTEKGVVFTDGTWLDCDAVVLATGYEPAIAEFLPEWRMVCGDAGRPRISGGPTALPGLYFCGQYVAPSGMLREMGIEARRIAADISGTPQPNLLDRAKALVRR